ncbi:hypothetical protein HHK36_009811 [Tetracentron sinense]|uniref:Uncharacterized protein n=1 Tax=Tetracentron sinense TaxID=13715 RepID=A0A834ZJP1_TETSI|nr:hypothetical protein HHK36_009811 [Tetracentron sinense]
MAGRCKGSSLLATVRKVAFCAFVYHAWAERNRSSAMDSDCLDLGCVSALEKKSNETIVDSENKDRDTEESIMTIGRVGKNRALKETGQSTLNAVNRSTSQIKKPPHRKSSPLNWFPRKKTDSYLIRKIRLLQEVGGMNLTLDETLGDSNPHYSRVEREKIAAKEAARKAMEARKNALVEASWCRILRAARIQNNEAEDLLLKAEESVAEAFEAARAMGVIMYDRPDCPRKPCEIESSSVNRGGSTTHTITASFETAFEVDIEVAAAVKVAFIRLANCHSSLNKDEFKDLLRTICQNPDTIESNEELSEFSSECESDTGSDLESGSHKDGFSSQDLNHKMLDAETRQRKCRNKQLPESINTTQLVDMILDRLKGLKEDELASLATIVATCGLNAVLVEVENSKQHDRDSGADYTSAHVTFARSSMSSSGEVTVKNSNMEYITDGQARRKQVVTELPSLDKFLVKHVSRLEKEVQDARKTRENESRKGSGKNPEGLEYNGMGSSDNSVTSSEGVMDLSSVLVKQSSKLEREIEEAKRKSGKAYEPKCKKLGSMQDGCLLDHAAQDIPEVPSLDKCLVKHVSRLEREVQEAKNRRKNDLMEGRRAADTNKQMASFKAIMKLDEMVSSFSIDGKQAEKENINSNKQVDGKLDMEQTEESITNLSQLNSTKYCSGGESLAQIEQAKLEALDSFSLQDGKEGSKETEYSLDKILVKPVHRLESEKMQALALGRDNGTWKYQKRRGGNDIAGHESLDKVLVKHVSRLEKEKIGLHTEEEVVKVKRKDPQFENNGGGLDQILVKHQSKLEKEKLAVSHQLGDQIKHSVARREAREKELQEAWGGLSLGNSIQPHLSRLERDKAS